MSNERLLTDKEIKGFTYRVSTSSPLYAFTDRDGTLDTRPFIHIKALLKAQDDRNRDKDFQAGFEAGKDSIVDTENWNYKRGFLAGQKQKNALKEHKKLSRSD